MVATVEVAEFDGEGQVDKYGRPVSVEIAGNWLSSQLLVATVGENSISQPLMEATRLIRLSADGYVAFAIGDSETTAVGSARRIPPGVHQIEIASGGQYVAVTLVADGSLPTTIPGETFLGNLAETAGPPTSLTVAEVQAALNISGSASSLEDIPDGITRSAISSGNPVLYVAGMDAPYGAAKIQADGKISPGVLPTGTMTLVGSWDASTNTPALVTGGGAYAAGSQFVVSVAGSTTLDGQSTWEVRDELVLMGTPLAWVRLASGATITPDFSIPYQKLVKLPPGLLGYDGTATGEVEALSPALARQLLNVADNAAPNPAAMLQSEAQAGTGIDPRIITPAVLKYAVETHAPGGGAVAGFKEPVADKATLKALAKPAVTEIRYVYGDGLGTWEWRPASTTTDNNSTVLQATAAGAGRWHRLGAGSDVDPKWFGAVVDGTTDDTASMVVARNYCRTFTPPGTLVINGNVRLSSIDLTGCSIICAGSILHPVGATITVGSDSEMASRSVVVDIPLVSDGAATLSTRATPQLRIIGKNNRVRAEAGYVQLYADGTSTDRKACDRNVIDLISCYVVAAAGVNGGTCKNNDIFGSIGSSTIDAAIHTGNFVSILAPRLLSVLSSASVATVVATVSVPLTGGGTGYIPIYSTRT